MRPIINILVIIVLIAFSTFALALPDDKTKPINIIADSSQYNYKTGIKIFEGHVTIIQGTTHLNADRVITKDNNQHKLNEVYAYGFKNRAHYWTIPKAGDPELHAKAQIIKFYPIESRVVLEKSVLVTQKDNRFTGDLLFYYMKDQKIIVPPTKGARAELVYNPEKSG